MELRCRPLIFSSVPTVPFTFWQRRLIWPLAFLFAPNRFSVNAISSLLSPPSPPPSLLQLVSAVSSLARLEESRSRSGDREVGDDEDEGGDELETGELDTEDLKKKTFDWKCEENFHYPNCHWEASKLLECSHPSDSTSYYHKFQGSLGNIIFGGKIELNLKKIISYRIFFMKFSHSIREFFFLQIS